jgi:hypothetical protein
MIFIILFIKGVFYGPEYFLSGRALHVSLRGICILLSLDTSDEKMTIISG